MPASGVIEPPLDWVRSDYGLGRLASVATRENPGAVRAAVVGHVEWVEFVHGDHVPAAGEIVHASHGFSEPAGGGAVAAVELARLAGAAELLTALGDDELAARSRERLAELGVSVRAAVRPGSTRRALTFIDSHGERTITTIGERLEPRAADELDWGSLEDLDCVYTTAADATALRAARAARILVASPRMGRVLADSGVALDALVYSDRDELESALALALDPRPALLVATRGAEGGRYEATDGRSGSWDAVALPGPIADSYGSGDTFAAAFAYGLAERGDIESALELAAVEAAACLTRQGPYGRDA